MSLEKSLTAALAAIIALPLAACGTGAASTAPVETIETALPVAMASPSRADIFATYHTTTTITADSEAAVPARVAGEVVEILVEEGDRVAEDQVLARLDGGRLRLEALQAKAEFEKVKREYERFVRLHEQGLVSSSALGALKFDMEAFEAAYELKRLDFEYTNIRATIAGVVSARDIKVGRHLAVNDAAFRITDTSRLVASLSIPQTELYKFAAGHRLEVRVDASPGQSFDALIARISPTIDQRNGTFRATAYIDNERGQLAPGMFGRFVIAYEKHPDALLVPLSALVEEDNETVVYVVEDGTAIRRVIRTGIQSGDKVEVLNGLDESERIVVSGQGSLRDGSPVFASIDDRDSISG